MPEHERRFALFGSSVRLLVGPPTDPRLPAPELAATAVEAFLRMLDRRLTRFDPRSELSRLNADRRDAVPVSPLLALAVSSGLDAARRTRGLVDPTLVGALEQQGYADSRAGSTSAPLAEAVAAAPPRAPAEAAGNRGWQRISVAGDPPVIRRPRGLRIETGGTTKGLAADLAARRLGGYRSFVVDVGGDTRIGGERPPLRAVEVEDPFTGGVAFEFELRSGAVATSGLRTRLWRHDGGFAHHLIDPATGRPAWTGVVQATAVADTALGAETLAKAALLSGPHVGRRLLRPGGGVLVLDDGTVAECGILTPRETRPADHPIPVGGGW